MLESWKLIARLIMHQCLSLWVLLVFYFLYLHSTSWFLKHFWISWWKFFSSLETRTGDYGYVGQFSRPNRGAVDNAQTWLAFYSTQAERRLVHLHLQSGVDLNQKFDVIVSSNVSCVRYAFTPQLCVFQAAGNISRNMSHAQSCSRVKPNVACICPGTDKCKRGILHSAWA